MQSSRDPKAAIKGRLGGSSLEDWPSFLENSPGEETLPPSPASLPARIAAYLRTPRGLGVLCILWLLFLLALVFVFMPLTSWVMQRSGSSASSTAVSLSVSGLDGWTARRLFCSHNQPCDALSHFSAVDPFNSKYETQNDNRAWPNQAT